MAVSGIEAAKRACQASGWKLSNLALQKILYLAHMMHLGRDGERLITDDFEAWDYGPVIPSVYRQVNAFGGGPVQNVFHGVADIEGTQEAALIDEAVNKLADLPPSKLVAATHRSGGAWEKSYEPGGPPSNVIPREVIKTEYETVWHE